MQQKNGNKSMIKISEIKMPVGYTEEMVTASILKKLHLKNDTALTWNYFKKSIDARKKPEINKIYTVLFKVENYNKTRKNVTVTDKEKNSKFNIKSLFSFLIQMNKSYYNRQVPEKKKTSHLISLMSIRFHLFLKGRKIVRWLLDLGQLVCLPLLF